MIYPAVPDTPDSSAPGSASRGSAAPGSAAGRATPSPLSKRKARKLQALLAAALRLVGEHGVDGWTIADLARAVELTPGALYRYFASKDAIVVALQVQVLQELVTRLEAAQAALPERGGPRALALARLLAAAQAHVTLAESAPERFALITQSVADPRRLVGDALVEPVWLHTLALVRRVVTDFALARATGALDSGPLSPAHEGAPAVSRRAAEDLGDNAAPDITAPDDVDSQRALLWLFADQGIVQLGKLARRMPGVLDIPALSDALACTLLRGWGASAADVRAARQLVRASTVRGRPGRHAPLPDDDAPDGAAPDDDAPDDDVRASTPPDSTPDPGA